MNTKQEPNIKKSIKVTYSEKTGGFKYESQNVSDDTLNYLKLLLEGDNFKYVIQRIPAPSKMSFSLLNGQKINTFASKSNLYKIVDEDDETGNTHKSLLTKINESGEFDLNSFTFELNNFKPRQKGRPINHHNKYFIIYHGTIERYNSPDYCWSYPTTCSRTFAPELISGLSMSSEREPDDGLFRIINEDKFLPSSLYLRIQKK